MPIQIRRISVLLRKLRSAKEYDRTLRNFGEWKELQRLLPAPRPLEKTVLIIRLDDIGDYLLFRNQLQIYKRAARWSGHFITLVVKESWKELFTALDYDAVDDTIWVDKNEYLASAAYRMNIWERLRSKGFEIVIAPSCTRPLLLDDFACWRPRRGEISRRPTPMCIRGRTGSPTRYTRKYFNLRTR